MESRDRNRTSTKWTDECNGHRIQCTTTTTTTSRNKRYDAMKMSQILCYSERSKELTKMTITTTKKQNKKRIKLNIEKKEVTDINYIFFLLGQQLYLRQCT